MSSPLSMVQRGAYITTHVVVTYARPADFRGCMGCLSVLYVARIWMRSIWGIY